MGKGDIRTRRGKIFRGTYGKLRRRKKKRKLRLPNPRVKIKDMGNPKVDNISRLYLLREVIVNLINQATNDSESDDKKKRILILRYRRQLRLLDRKIQDLRNGLLQFSIEELYSMFGRYDKFISIEFHPKSESAVKFGNSIMGILIYNRREREDLNETLKLTEIPRTNGYVKIKPSDLCELNAKQKEELITTGFLSGDIFEINNTAIEYHDSYIDKSSKEIPGTININFDPTGFNPELMSLYLLEKRISKNNKPLITSELYDYYALKILYKISEISEDEWKTKIFESNSKEIKEEIRYRILKSKFDRSLALTKEELSDFKKFIEVRKKERFALVDKEIKKSANKKLKDLIAENGNLIEELKSIAFFFKDENLSPFGSKHPVYLDLERFLHIFIRHYQDFQIGDWKGSKTHFQYSFRDTTRLMKIVIENLQPKIDKSLDQGKEFSISDKKAYYFNGNYYVIHIDKSGRLLSFYPHDNK